MNRIIDKLKEIDTGQAGIMIYSTKDQKMKASWNAELTVPLASAAKVAIGFCMAKWAGEGKLKWDDMVEGISFNPKEDSRELYPHLQKRTSLPLREAVEVMVACHDSFAAKSIVGSFGGWEKVNEGIQSDFPFIQVTEDPRHPDNKGMLSELAELMKRIYQGYNERPMLWAPIINGLVRQRGDIGAIPGHHLNHMTGGLEHAAVDVGIMGDFNSVPYIFVVGTVNVPDRNEYQETDNKIVQAMNLVYENYLDKEV
ncbi:serine hydrolase [Lysinibacillus sphaericus]